MKKIGITQKEQEFFGYHETQDVLDQRWMDLFFACQLEPFLLPNHLPTIERYLFGHQIDGLIFSGGNDVNCALRRDQVEKRLMEWAHQNCIPILGVCRGMQMLQLFFGGTLTRVANHVNTSHMTHFAHTSRITNSFHHFAIFHLTDHFIALAKSSDGIIESMRHKELPWYGIMWHPEREHPFIQEDLDFIRGVFR